MARGASTRISVDVLVAILVLSFGRVKGVSCPSGWIQRPDEYECYQFVTDTSSWDEARAYCGIYEGSLVSLNKPGENEWVISQISGNQDYWIGLVDNDGLLQYAWSDGSVYDPSTASWASGQPSHGKGERTCVKMSARDNWKWVDSDCGPSKAFVCERSLSTSILCDEANGWQAKSGNCYYLSDVWRNFNDAQTYCEQFDASLMDVKDADEQELLVELVIEEGFKTWIGYRTDNGKNNFRWTSGATWNYQNWGPNEPEDDQQMCTWVESVSTLTGNWSTGDCNSWLTFICEKPQGMCYPGWKMHNGYCYQLSANEPTTWMYAKEYCEKEGAVLLTIKSEAEQEFINQQLASLSQSGIENLWFGISDVDEDGTIKWADGTDLAPDDFQNWASHTTPVNREDENQCGSIYTESSNGQWDYGDCINEFSFACKIREGSAVNPVDPDVPTGYCPEHWYHYENNCYYVNNTGITFDEAEQICVANGGHLASIHSGGEMSFIELRLSKRDYYIGLGDRDNEGDYKWTDGTPFDYRNWDLNEPNDRGGSEECVQVRGPYVTPSGVWNDISCDALYSFICKKAASTTTPAPPTNPPEVGCYEPYTTYLGNAQVTVDGDACLNWKEANRYYNPTDYPDAHLDGNYCRNPSYGPKPWCYVADEDIEWKECDVPQCNAPIDCYEGDGYMYRGKAAVTSGGNECLPWSSLDSRAFYRPETYPEEGLVENYCRNPSGSSYGPWCYYSEMLFGYVSSSCGIEKCNTTGCYEGSGRNYRGSAHTAADGSECVRWDQATSMPFNPTTYNNSGLDENYCRNPSGDDEPWCYVDVDMKLVQEMCDVPHCSNDVGCYVGRGSTYRGKANYVTIGRSCLNWVDFIDEFYPVPEKEFAVTTFHSIRDVSEVIEGISLSQCAYECLHDHSHFCKSFNYYSGSSGTQSLCSLSQYNDQNGDIIPDGHTDYYQRNQTYGLEENYCRNPNDAAAPWCYFYDPRNNRTDWGYCGVPECNPQDVGCYNALDDGASYRGAARTTASGHVCIEWKDTFYTPDRYPNSGLEENYCRNPTFFRYAPFCYYKGTSGNLAEYCDIPECEVEELCAGDDWIVGPTEEWCYKISTDTPQTFEEAQDKCADDGATLTSITSESESTFLFGKVQDLNQLGFWIGATDIQQEAGWEWTDGSPFAYLHWEPGQPDNLHGTEACVLMSGIDGQWTDENCDLTFSHICKKRSEKPFTTMAPTTLAPGIRCPTDWSRYGSHCYLVQQDQTDWYTASRACEDLDSSLASVHSDDEMKHIVSKLEEAGREYYFFGANNIGNQDQWVFGNGTGETPVSYTNWADGQPDNFGADGEDCVAMLYTWNWQWNDADCESRYQVVCEDENNSGDMKLGRYTAHRESMTFADAQDHCKKYDGTMATMLNDDDRDTMKELLNNFYDPFYPDIFWLGVNDIKTENSWVTGGDPDSKTPQTYTDWHTGEPNNYKSEGERCGMMAPQDDSDSSNEHFEWYDWGCGNAERYICENIDPESRYVGDNDRTFTVVNEALTWAEADADCKKRHGRLAQVLSSSDQTSINFMLYDNKEKLLTSKGAWLGLNDRMHQMTYEWVDGSAVSYTNWNSGEPDDFAEAQDCVFTYSQNGKESTGRKYYAGKWADYQCDDEDFGYVCKKTASAFGPSEIPPPEFDCPTGWFGSDTFCYLLLETQMSWADAVAECKSYTDHGKSTNTTIAYIPNSEEEYTIADALSGETGLYWIGLHDPNREGTYQWEGGQPVTYTNWDTRQPGNEQHPCVAMSAGEDSLGRWDDQSCDSRYSVICQKPRHDDYVPEFPPTPSPSGSCSPGWVEYGSYCYLIQREVNDTGRLSFINAAFDCMLRTSDWSSYLASIHSHGEERFIQEQVQALTPSVDVEEEFWLGLTEYGGGYFEWYDGSQLNYVNWGPGVPDDLDDGQYLAAVMYPASTDKGWQFIPMESLRSWICKAPKGSEMYTTMPPVSPGKSERCEEGGNWQRWDYNADLDECYLFMGSDLANRVTWFEAISRCSAEQSSMVSVHSKEENFFVQELVKTNGVNVMWLGMYDQETHGGFQWIDESPANYFKWDANEPGNSVTSCISMDSETGGWKLEDCGETMSFMCKRNIGGGSVTPAPTERAPGYCPKGWVSWGNKCLKVQDHLDSWTSARNHCMILGGDLASVRDEKEEALVVSLLENVAGPIWIGLNDLDHEGLFTWADGSPVFHTNWATNEPNNWGGQENCVHMFGSDGALPGTWNDAECTQQYFSLCQRPRDPDGTPVAPTLSLCQSYYHYGNSCFKLYDGSYTREQAKSLCESDGLGSTLASINSVYEQEKIRLMMATEGITSPMYIGLTFADHRFSWDDGWPVSYTNWGHGEPSLGPLETCTIFDPSTDRWSDVMCNQSCGAVCKFTFDSRPVQPTVSPEDCPSDEWVPFGGACYRGFFYDNEWVRWTGAEYACPTYDAHMVSLHSDEEVDFVLSLIPDGIYSIWVGLNRIEDLGFEWEDNSPFEYIMWAPGEPSGTGSDSLEEECTQMYTTGNSAGQWNDLNCYEKLPYVCKYTVYGLRPGTTPDGRDNPGSGINIGLIVGATLGGVAFLVVLVVLLALLKRQKRMVAYFRSVAGLEVAPEELFNEDGGRRSDIDGDESARENFGRNDSQRSFDDAMLSIN